MAIPTVVKKSLREGSLLLRSFHAAAGAEPLGTALCGLMDLMCFARSCGSRCGRGPVLSSAGGRGRQSARRADLMDGRASWLRLFFWTSSTSWRGFGLPSSRGASSLLVGSRSGWRAFRNPMEDFDRWRSRSWRGGWGRPRCWRSCGLGSVRGCRSVFMAGCPGAPSMPFTSNLAASWKAHLCGLQG